MFKRTIRFIVLLALSGTFVFCAVALASGEASLERIKKRGILLWGSDAEGGAPYVFPDPNEPSRLIGFEVDLAEAIAREMDVKPQQVQNAWDSLIPALRRGDFDVAMNGIEITPIREQEILFSMPYYIYTEQLVVRIDETEIQSINDLKGEKSRYSFRSCGSRYTYRA